MKIFTKKILCVIFIILMLFTIVYGQNIINKIGGTGENDEFQVTDSEGDVKLTVQGDGKVGIRTTTPNGIMDIQTDVGGFMIWSHDGLDQTIQIIIPDGDNDVKKVLKIEGLWLTSNNKYGIINENGLTLDNTYEAFLSNEIILLIMVNNDGSVTIQGMSETLTLKVILKLMWI